MPNTQRARSSIKCNNEQVRNSLNKRKARQPICLMLSKLLDASARVSHEKRVDRLHVMRPSMATRQQTASNGLALTSVSRIQSNFSTTCRILDDAGQRYCSAARSSWDSPGRVLLRAQWIRSLSNRSKGTFLM